MSLYTIGPLARSATGAPVEAGEVVGAGVAEDGSAVGMVTMATFEGAADDAGGSVEPPVPQPVTSDATTAPSTRR
jgi:hypothetical protein